MSKISVGFFLFVLFACSSPDESKGIALFKNNCAGCHITPDIRVLPKSIWAQHILPEMGHRLGIQDTAFDPLKGLSFPEMEAVLKTGAFPWKAALSPEDWELLKNYILHIAPDSLIFPEKQEPPGELRLFAANAISLDSNGRSTITMLKFDERSEKMIAGDISGNLYALDGMLRKKYLLGRFPGGVVDYTEKEGAVFATTIGNLRPSELTGGAVFRIKGTSKEMAAKNLHRPVHALVYDFNRDGKDELVISEFGDLGGRLSLLSIGSEQQLQSTVLLNQPGTIRAVAEDMDKDGKKDIVVLTAQGDEWITILFQQDNLRFVARKVIRFSPVYGSRWFELLDYDEDGDMDIITVNGDNADRSAIKKPYHGMRIHLNQGDNSFKEVFLPGATRVVARDFDQDGDVDIAILSTFPDYQGHESPFMYLENQDSKSFSFVTATAVDAMETARWFLMDTGDVDGAGDLDIVLSAFSLSFNVAPERLARHWQENDADLMFLENTLKGGSE